jgi:hypothetical protein
VVEPVLVLGLATYALLRIVRLHRFAFVRWGLPGLLCTLLLLLGIGSWIVTTFSWVFTGIFYGLAALAGLGYVLLFVFAVLWLRGRRQGAEHLLGYGRRRRWPY